MPQVDSPRALKVSHKTQITPSRIRIGLLADDIWSWGDARIADFLTLHVPGDGAEFVDRHYTIREYAPITGEITVEFALLGTGPATRWAREVGVGDRIMASLSESTRSENSPVHACDYIMAGDDAAIPAISRHLEGSGAFDMVTVIVESADVSEATPFRSLSTVNTIWLPRTGLPGEALSTALWAHLKVHAVDCVWIAAEAGAVARMRPELATSSVGGLGSLHIFAYWRANALAPSGAIAANAAIAHD